MADSTVMKHRKLRMVESAVFFAGWTAVMLLGADFPHPEGFIWVIFGIAVLDFMHWLYLGWLLDVLRHRKTFALNLVLFSIAGLITALLTAVLNGKIISETIIWFIIITLASAVYGIIFWSINCLIVKKTG